MPRCPSCRERLPADPAHAGARCPHCRDPLYERPASSSRWSSRADGQCAVHPSNPAVGTCQRCGNFHCAVCRTRWRGQVLCLACVERAFETNEAAPEEARTHFRQALWSLICGIGGWLLGLAGLVLTAIAFAAGPEHPAVVIVLPGMLCLLAAPLPIVPSLGLGATAIRERGNHLILATAGLILSGLEAGAFIGVICLSMWRN